MHIFSEIRSHEPEMEGRDLGSLYKAKEQKINNMHGCISYNKQCNIPLKK